MLEAAAGRCCSGYSLYCFIVRIVSRNALDISAGREGEELEGRVGELDARGLRTVGYFVFLLLAWEYAIRKGGHTRKRVGMCGDP